MRKIAADKCSGLDVKTKDIDHEERKEHEEGLQTFSPLSFSAVAETYSVNRRMVYRETNEARIPIWKNQAVASWASF